MRFSNFWPTVIILFSLYYLLVKLDTACYVAKSHFGIRTYWVWCNTSRYKEWLCRHFHTLRRHLSSNASRLVPSNWCHKTSHWLHRPPLNAATLIAKGLRVAATARGLSG